MWEIHKYGSVRGVEVLAQGLNIVTLFIPKGKRNWENKQNLNEGCILCLLDKAGRITPLTPLHLCLRINLQLFMSFTLNISAEENYSLPLTKGKGKGWGWG
ncbi:MAG: hypothetical protein K8S23_08870 [Candidatus Cloacimonetes bacterium]|nr:hypothetical protein [Candidatus Cloacimonadota bacterium]